MSRTTNIRRSSIRRCLVPGNSKSLWNTFNMAKDINPNEIPLEIKLNKIDIIDGNTEEVFAEYFDYNVKTIVNSFKVDNEAYNIHTKLNCVSQNFINEITVMKALDSIKIKNTDGYNRIPQQKLNEGKSILINLITNLLNLIYKNKVIPEQWSISKIIQILKQSQKIVWKITSQ